MEVVNPSMTVSRLDLGGSGLCGGWVNISSTPLGFLEYLGIYRAKRRFGGQPRWAQPTRARLGLQARPRVLCSPRAPSSVLLWPTGCLLVQKNPKSFAAFGNVKNMQKTTTGTWHYVNRLVPKNDIK